MATADTTTDDDTTTQTASPPAAAGSYDPAMLNRLLQQLMQPPQQPQPVAQPSSTEGRGALSLLGEAIGGGQQYGTTQQREAAGLRALQSMGMNMMANSGYAPVRTPFGQILASGMQGAQQSLGESQQVEAAQMAAQQQYSEKQQEMNLARLKVALPLLTLKTQMDQAAAARNLAGGGGAAPGTSVATGGSISGNTYEAAIGGHEGLTADKNLPTTVGGFIPSTWQAFAAANPDLFKGMSPDQVAAARSDPKLNAAGITWLAQQNAGELTKNGAPVTGPSLGIAHYLGAGAAAKVMAAPDNTPVSSFVSDAAVKANPELATLTVGQLKQRYANVPAPGFLTPTKTASGAPAAPTPTTPPAASTAPPGSGFGMSAFNAPARTVMPAPASQADAPNTTDTLPPVPTPQMAAARALAVKAGRPMPIAGTDGLFANPDGSVGSGPKAGGISGKRADISPIVGGMQTAETTMPPGSVVGAGPAAGGGTAPTVPLPAPAGAFGGGAFTTAPAQIVGAPAAPTPPVTPQATPPVTPQATPPVATPPAAGGPAAPTPPTAGGRDFDVNQPFAYKPGTLPTTEDFNPHLTPAQQAAFDLRRQQIATLPFAQQPEAYANLTSAIQDATQSKAQAAAAAATKYQETEKQQQFDAWKQLQKQASDERLAQIQSGNTVTQERAKAQFGVESTQLNNINKAADAARDKAGELDVMQSLSNAAGSADPIGQIKIGDHTIAQLLSNYGWGNEADLNKLTAEQALTLAAQKYGMDMRSGQGMGRLTNQELTFVQNMVPNPGQQPDTRNAMIAYLRVQQQRQLDYAGEVNRLWSKGVALPDAQEQAEKTLGPTLKQMPSNLNDPSPQGATNTYGWMRSNGIAPGTFYKRWDGRLMISPQTYPEQ